MQTIKELVRTIILSLVLIAGVSMVSAWTGPTQAPPGGNVSAPINIGLALQSKEGPIAFKGAFETQNTTLLATLGGNVGIGTASPTQKLQVAGATRIDGDLWSRGNMLVDAGLKVEGTFKGGSPVDLNGGIYIYSNEIGGVSGKDIYLNPFGGRVYVKELGLSQGSYLELGDGARKCVRLQSVGNPATATGQSCDWICAVYRQMACVSVEQIGGYGLLHCGQTILNTGYNCICCP